MDHQWITLKIYTNINEYRKTAGQDEVYMELLKYAPDGFICAATEWDLGIKWTSNCMEKNCIIKKKAKPRNVWDFRKVSLCSAGYKIYAKWFLGQFNEYVGEIGSYQAAFTNQRSTDDNMFMVRRVMEEFWCAVLSYHHIISYHTHIIIKKLILLRIVTKC